MYTYKTVPAPANLIVKKDKDREKVVEQFGDLINKECKDGWEFYSMETITTTTQGGLLSKEESIVFNMLVFRKEE